jgi:hypothetical protein
MTISIVEESVVKTDGKMWLRIALVRVTSENSVWTDRTSETFIAVITGLQTNCQEFNVFH